MNTHLIINTSPLNFNLLINKDNIKFDIADIDYIDINNIINYDSIKRCIIGLTVISILSILLLNVSYFMLMVLNLLLLVIYIQIFYKKSFLIKIKIREMDYILIVNDEYLLFKFQFLYELHKNIIY